jgi:hypothetical protein
MSAWIAHAGAAVVIAALMVFLWRPAAVRSSTDIGREERIKELAARLGDPTPNPVEIERILPTASRFPPDEAATHSLANALSACGMSGLSESSRVTLARRLYAITTGGDLPRDRLAVILDQILDAAISARCSPIAIGAIVDSARRVARTDPKPRKDWW